jgi:hypothetical protein
MNKIKTLFVLFLLIVFFTGLYMYTFDTFRENMEERKDESCPNLLVNRGGTIYLYNTNVPLSDDGSNPKIFQNLDEYIRYLEEQRRQGNECPVLYLQQENDTQGNDVYRVRPSPFNPQGGAPIMMTRAEFNHQDKQVGMPPILLTSNTGSNLDRNRPVQVVDASRQDPPFNQGQYPGFDPTSLYVGTYTNIDAVHDSTAKTGQWSENPADPNWGGVMYTEQAVQSGKYDENNVVIPVFPKYVV